MFVRVDCRVTKALKYCRILEFCGVRKYDIFDFKRLSSILMYTTAMYMYTCIDLLNYFGYRL